MNTGIAAGHEETARAAADVLQAGGNAVDAAIAAFFMSWVAEPCMSSAGGGAFALVAMEGEPIVLYDFFCQTPRQKRPPHESDFFPVTVDFGDTREVFHVGKGATAVPGAVAGIFALHRRYGTMPMTDLVQPAAAAAKNGVIVNDFQHFDFDLVKPILELHERTHTVFFPGGKVAAVGERICLSDMADFLEVLAKEGEALFYQGEIAQQIVRDYSTGGGSLTMEDFAGYQVRIRQPLHFPWHGKTVYTNPAPSIGGAIIALTMGALADENVPDDYLSEAHIERMYRVFAQVDALGKSPEHLHQAVRTWQQKTWGSTTHFNVADRRGNAVSLSSTIGEGCGYVVPGADILLNNMLGEAALMPNGFHSWRENVRLSSMMAPTMVCNETQQPEIVLGTGGASRIAFAISQVLSLLIDYKLPVEVAVNAPRVHWEHDILHIEAGFKDIPAITLSAQQQLKLWQQRSLFFGGVHTLRRIDNYWTAAGDERRDGVALIAP